MDWVILIGSAAFCFHLLIFSWCTNSQMTVTDCSPLKLEMDHWNNLAHSVRHSFTTSLIHFYTSSENSPLQAIAPLYHTCNIWSQTVVHVLCCAVHTHACVCVCLCMCLCMGVGSWRQLSVFNRHMKWRGARAGYNITSYWRGVRKTAHYQ